MLKSRLIRFVVNLCVIGTLLISPIGLTTVMANSCIQSASTATKCSGCKRCSVSSQDVSCGCCCKKQTAIEVQTASQKSCCHRAEGVNTKPKQPNSALHICLCSNQPQPAIPTPPNQSLIEQLQRELATTSLDIVSLPNELNEAFALEKNCTLPSYQPHEFQQRLCIWLI